MIRKNETMGVADGQKGLVVAAKLMGFVHSEIMEIFKL